MKTLLLLACFAGCSAKTEVRNMAGKTLFSTNATATALQYKGPDGSSLAMWGVDHTAIQRALADTITARGMAASSLLTAAASAMLFRH